MKKQFTSLASTNDMEFTLGTFTRKPKIVQHNESIRSRSYFGGRDEEQCSRFYVKNVCADFVNGKWGCSQLKDTFNKSLQIKKTGLQRTGKVLSRSRDQQNNKTVDKCRKAETRVENNEYLQQLLEQIDRVNKQNRELRKVNQVLEQKLTNVSLELAAFIDHSSSVHIKNGQLQEAVIDKMDQVQLKSKETSRETFFQEMSQELKEEIFKKQETISKLSIQLDLFLRKKSQSDEREYIQREQELQHLKNKYSILLKKYYEVYRQLLSLKSKKQENKQLLQIYRKGSSDSLCISIDQFI